MVSFWDRQTILKNSMIYQYQLIKISFYINIKLFKHFFKYILFLHGSRKKNRNFFYTFFFIVKPYKKSIVMPQR